MKAYGFEDTKIFDIPTKTQENHKWLSGIPKNCEICDEPIGEYFIDGNTYNGWALMCEKCHSGFGGKLGIGFGQKYLTKTGEGVEGFTEQ